MARINWNEVIPAAIEQAQEYKREYNEAPTLRAIYYRLVSVEVIPNTKSAYKGLSRVLSQARVDDEFPWDLMQDKTRTSTGTPRTVSLDYVKRWAGEAVEDALQTLGGAFESIQDPSVSWRPDRWDGQPKRVIVAIEKEAIMGAVQNVLRGWNVEIFPLRGYTSTTFMKEMAEAVDNLDDYGHVQLVIVTDYDPSGEDMVRDLQERLWRDYNVSCNAEKVLLTKQQILDNDLPATPEDAEEIAKMRRDPRFTGWEDGLYRVELDAMAAIKPNVFRQIIKESVSKHWDEEIYQERHEEAEMVCNDAESELKDLYKKLEQVHLEVVAKIAEIQGGND